MARTQRCRALQSAENAAAHTKRSRADAAARLSATVWTRTTETLNGLLRVEFPSPFTNLELLCPKEAWLVVHLTSIHAAASGLRHQLRYTLDVLTQILVHAETVRPWQGLYEAFWRRVLTSEMIQRQRHEGGEEKDELWMRGFIRFVRAKGTNVALEWRGRRLDSDHVVTQLHKWLATELDIGWPSLPSRQHVPVQVAVRFEDCELTDKRLRAIYTLLKRRNAAGDKLLLCDEFSLRELSLRGNTFQAHALRDLALVLEDPSTRRLDGLVLDSTVPDQAHQTAAYAAAFCRVIAALLSASPRAVSSDDPGVSLSLRDWSIFDAAIVNAVLSGVLHATRPLRALSLACWHLEAETAQLRFGHLLLTRLPTATEEFDLDVSCVRGSRPIMDMGDDVEEALHDARNELISAALPRVSQALATGRRVSCRLLYWAQVARDLEMNISLDCELSQILYYDVRQVSADGGYQIVIPTTDADEEETTVWTNWWTIANIRIDTEYVLRCDRSGLIVDRCRRQDDEHEARRVVLVLAAVTGAQLTRLSMRHNAWNAEQYLSWCPRLKEFNAEGGRTECRFGAADGSSETGQSLQVVNVSRCDLKNAPLKTVLKLPHLRSLCFALNPVKVVGLEVLYDTLVRSSTLEAVDVRPVRDEPWTQSHARIRTTIDTLLHNEYTSVEARWAFLLVLARLEMNGVFVASVSRESIELILSFASRQTRRIVQW